MMVLNYKSIAGYLLGLSIITLFSCESGQVRNFGTEASISEAHFVGHDACIECHQEAFDQWMGSDHERAMDTAVATSVLGDFNNAQLITQNDTIRFYTRENKYYILAPGADGIKKEHEIAYTFGYRPLQQYLVRFEKGRLQCLPYTWDVQTKQWYSLVDSVYAGEDLSPHDWLYWTNNGQNWNAMCAECHSTDLKVNYDAQNRSFSTQWNSINVSCEACHGPASNHLLWADLDSVSQIGWSHTGFDRASIDLNSDQLMDQCVYCHARRSSMTDNGSTGDSYLNHMLPELISIDHYEFDGQIRDEDYVFGSFTQSRMHHRDVKCNDCHQVHSLETKLKGNTLCAQCHDYKVYDTPEHHFHNVTGTGQSKVLTNNGLYDQGDGTQCVDCHMTGQKYMGVDFRRDHSFRIPRPDVAEATGGHDACTDCHSNQSKKWAIEKLEEWYPNRKPSLHYGEVFYLAYEGEDMRAELNELITDTSHSEMVKASAIMHLGRLYPGYHHPEMKKALYDSSALARYAASRFYTDQSTDAVNSALLPMLDDSIAAIRLFAVQHLLQNDLTGLDTIRLKQLNEETSHYLSYLNRTAYMPSSRYNLGVYHAKAGDINEAQKQLKIAVDIDDRYYPALLNLAITASQKGQLDSAQYWLDKILKYEPQHEQALYYSALLWVEKQAYENAFDAFQKLIELYPKQSRYYYNASLLANTMGKSKLSIDYMINAVKWDPANPEYRYTLAYLYVENQQSKKAKPILQSILNAYPDYESAKLLLQSINSTAK